jgi:uncharacterized protein (TIGR02118 family)
LLNAEEGGGMTKFVVLWNLPEAMSEDEFERRYFEEHVPLARAVPGVRKYLTTKFTMKPDGSPPPYYRMAEFDYDSYEAFQAGQTSPQAIAAREQVQEWGFRDIVFMLGDEAVQEPSPPDDNAEEVKV